MGIPQKQKNINAHVDGLGYAGEIAEFEEPTLAVQTEEYRGGGMIGPVTIDLGLQPMQCMLKMGGHTAALIAKFGATQVDGVRVRLTAAYQRDDTGQAQGVEIYIGGRFTEIGFGTGKAGEDTEHEYTVPLSYYRRVVDGRTVIEIDMIAGTYIVDGVDRYAEINRIIQN